MSADPATSHSTDFHYSGWSGLGSVFDLKQSSEGYLWLTTSKGVLRFDGVRFQSIEEVTRQAVHDEEIDSVFVSPSGGLWLTTEGAGLLFWKNGHMTSFPDRRCTPIRKQGKLVEDHDGSLWVQATAGLFRLRGSACEQVGAEQGYPGGFPAGILMDSDGTLWVKTRTGPLLFLPRGQSKFQASKAGEGLSTGFAYLHEAPDGGIWLSDDQGLRRVTYKLSAADISRSPTPLRGKTHYGDFAFGPDKTLWAVADDGVQRFDDIDRWPTPVASGKLANEVFTPEQGLTSDSVWKVLIDREGVWIGTNSGLDWLRRAALTTVPLPHAQEHEYSVAAGDGDSVWTGNSSLPLTHVAADGSITSFPITRQTLTVRRDHNGTIWSASDFHLWRSSGKGFSPLDYPDQNLDSVVFVATDRNNQPWITTSTGRVYELSGGKWNDETLTLGKKPGVMGAMVDDQAGNVWFAFSNKVVRWDGADFHRFSFPDGHRGVNENTMSVTGDHVWLGGAGGIQLFTNGKFYLMNWKDHNLPGRVSGIVETHSGDLWVNGFSGITHVPASQLKSWLDNPSSAVSGEHLDELDGLPGLSGETLPDPSVVEASDGRLWFATTRGVAWLDPRTFERNRDRLPPPVVISTVIADGKTYADSNSIRLPARNQNLEIDYTALSLAIPERVLFRYKLEGRDNDWRDVGDQRRAFYTNMAPGNYRFRVTACNNSGVWNQAGAILDFSIAPAYYQTAWFRLLCVAGFVVSLWGLYRLRVRQLARQFNMGLEARVSERTRIARDLHDTLLQSFQGLLLRFQTVSQILPAGKAKQILDSAIDQAAEAITEGRNAVQDLRSSTVEANDLAVAIETLGEQFAADETNPKSVVFRVGVEGKPRNLHPILRDEIYRIAGEALRNAFNHAQASQIEVEIRYDDRQFRVRVRDDGKGIDPRVLGGDGRAGHYGLHGMRERANLMGGRLALWSELNSGTEVELNIPASNVYATSPARHRSWLLERLSGKGARTNS